jgi:hypothetical protein
MEAETDERTPIIDIRRPGPCGPRAVADASTASNSRLAVRRGLPGATTQLLTIGGGRFPDERASSAGSGLVGYLIVLVGVAGVVLSCFLPYTTFDALVPAESSSSPTFSYYRLVTTTLDGERSNT